MKKRILVMGAGLIGSRHVQTLKANTQCDLVGVVDPDIAQHSDRSVRYFKHIDDVDEAVDGVIIATPTGLHAEHGIQAAQRGWHMLIEKPVTATPEQAETLSLALNTHKVKCLVGHHRRYHDSVKRLKSVIDQGLIGTPITTSLLWVMCKPPEYFEGNWRQSDGSPVMINLIHDIDLLRHVLGEVTHTTGFASQHIRHAGRVESGAVALKFKSGLTGTISFADTAPSPWGFEAATNENPNIAGTGQDMWWISGSRGGISFPSLTLWGGASDWSQAPIPATLQSTAVTPLASQLAHFCDVIDGEVPLVSIQDAQQSLRLTRQLENSLCAMLSP